MHMEQTQRSNEKMNLVSLHFLTGVLLAAELTTVQLENGWTSFSSNFYLHFNLDII